MPQGVWGVYDCNGDGVLNLEEFSRFFEVVVRKQESNRQQVQGVMATTTTTNPAADDGGYNYL
eukprot:COSAG01_NODE_4258_length_5201_cov_4.634065_2_plen_63_part_00